MTTRKEKREAADLRRAEIAKEIFGVMSSKIEEEEIKGTFGVTQLEEALKEGDKYVNKMMKQNPQEKHMIKSAAIFVRLRLEKFLKEIDEEIKT